MNKEKKVAVIFVCMGNICRSPTAEGMFRSLVEQRGLSHLIDIDSAGTHAYHVGELPDPRSRQTAKSRGIDLDYIRARKVEVEDLHQFDYILAMDSDNHANLMRIAPPGTEEKIFRFLEFSQDFSENDVPDPYYGGPSGFDRVFDMVESASLGLLEAILQELKSRQ